MNYVEKIIKVKDETLVLNNLRVVHWPEQRTLILSDLHIGKSAYFRKHGIPISSNVQENDLERLSFLVGLYKPSKLIIVGDLFHSGQKNEISLFLNWLQNYATLTIHLIKGNHDRISRENLSYKNIEVHEDHLKLLPFEFVHDPENIKENFGISGHLHPGIRIKSRGRPGITLPCYKLSNSQLVLPAFSMFTGLATEQINKNHKYFAFTDASFFEF